MIEIELSFGYRTIATLRRFNKSTVQQVFQLTGWRLLKRAIGHRPWIEGLPSVATTPNERGTTDLCRVWMGRDGWRTSALVIRMLQPRDSRLVALWKRHSDDSDSRTPTSVDCALRQSRTCRSIVSIADNELVFVSEAYIRIVRSYSLQQQFITPLYRSRTG